MILQLKEQSSATTPELGEEPGPQRRPGRSRPGPRPSEALSRESSHAAPGLLTCRNGDNKLVLFYVATFVVICYLVIENQEPILAVRAEGPGTSH